MNWRQDAACRGQDPELFFLGRTGPAWMQLQEAKRVCGTCSVARRAYAGPSKQVSTTESGEVPANKNASHSHDAPPGTETETALAEALLRDPATPRPRWYRRLNLRPTHRRTRPGPSTRTGRSYYLRRRDAWGDLARCDALSQAPTLTSCSAPSSMTSVARDCRSTRRTQHC